MTACQGSTVELSFRLWHDLEANFDYLVVHVFNNGEWTERRTYTGPGTTCTLEISAISSYMTADFRVSCDFYSDETLEYRGNVRRRLCICRTLTLGGHV